ncbi:aspartate aminotransferase family protein [Variovorax paradoxus]|uniref:aspartate aminotransferase family protein n=1 Tax=Variovorax paradoxus TaxID=34073 RepID=UPI0024787ACF
MHLPALPDTQTQDLLTRRASTMGPAYRLFYDEPLVATRAEGVWIYDAQGHAHLDAYNNVASLGHSHPKVLRALQRQAATLATHTRYVDRTVIDYLERLLGNFPLPLTRAMLTCTGSEANDLALRIACAATGGTGVIVTQTAYHGVTTAVAHISPSLGDGVPLGAHVRTVPAPQAISACEPEAVGPAFARGVVDAIADLRRHGIVPAALIVDTIFSSDGVRPDPRGFLQPAADAIRAAGGLFIADEVQAGFGRTGDTLWGFARHGLVPDLVTLGKPMGNGYPIAGVVARADLVDAFAATSRYFNTFGGNAVACATAMAVLGVIEDEGLVENARRVGTLLRQGLQERATRHRLLGDVRGAGLFLGVDVVAPGSAAPDAAGAQRLVNRLRAHRVLISATGPDGHVLKIRPPIIFSEENAAFFLERFDRALLDLDARA